MLDCSKDKGPLREWLGYIEDPAVRDAYLYILGIAVCSNRFTCDARWKGEVRDFRFHEANGEQPHSFITTKNWLLFYFRPPAIRHQAYSRDTVARDFDSFEETPAGEWHVKLRTVADVQRLSDHIRWSTP